MPSVSFQAPNEYSTELADIERRRKYAELLQQQAMQPVQQQPTPAGGFAVPTSWTQGLAKMMQGYAANKGLERATEDQKALSGRRGQAMADALGGMPKATPGQPEQWNGAPEEPAVYRPPQQGQQPSMQQNAAWLGKLAQIGPDATQMGGTILGMQQKQDENALNRESKTLDRIMALDAAALNASATREQKAASQQQAEALRRELASQADTTRREMQSSQQAFMANQNRQAAADRAANRPAPAVQPLVQVMTPNGPQWVERKDAVGKMPAGAGSQSEAKVAGKADVDKDVIKLKNMLDDLRAGGGITDTAKGGASNVGAWIGSSAVGQTAGGMVGSKNQSARNEMLMIRPSLLRSVMQSTGMSAKQMDSNAELKLWLSTATDPTKDYQANVAALNNIASKYGSGGFLDESAPKQTAAGKITPPAQSAPAGVDPKVWSVMTPQERALFR